MKKMKLNELDCIPLSATFLKSNGLTLNEDRYLLELIEVFKELDVMQDLTEKWDDIVNMEDPVKRLEIIDSILEAAEDYRFTFYPGWKKDSEMRMSIVSKLKCLDNGFEEFFNKMIKK